jgi:hypothetical protein
MRTIEQRLQQYMGTTELDATASAAIELYKSDPERFANYSIMRLLHLARTGWMAPHMTDIDYLTGARALWVH